MIRLLSIPFLFILLGCDTTSPKQIFLPPDKKDINEIVEAVINQDSSLLKNITVADPNNIPLLLDLRKIRVILTDTTTDVPPPLTIPQFQYITFLIV